MPDIKVQFVAGKEQTDLRGDLLIGKEQGDHHDTIKEFRVDDAVAEAMLPGLVLANAKSANAIGEQLDILEAHIPGAKRVVMDAMGIATGESIDDAEVIGFQTRIYSND